MMNELVTAAKDSLGLRSIWIDDEDYELIINAVLMKVAGYDESEVKMMALASSDRLNRLLRICRDIKWTSFRSEEHTSELQSLMRISYAVFCLKTKNTQSHNYRQ